MKMNNGKFKTSDLYVAAWLLTQGLVLEGVGGSDSRRLDFIFEDRGARPELVKDFIAGRATGNISDYIYQLKRLKNLLYAELKGNR